MISLLIGEGCLIYLLQEYHMELKAHQGKTQEFLSETITGLGVIGSTISRKLDDIKIGIVTEIAGKIYCKLLVEIGI